MKIQSFPFQLKFLFKQRLVEKLQVVDYRKNYIQFLIFLFWNFEAWRERSRPQLKNVYIVVPRTSICCPRCCNVSTIARSKGDRSGPFLEKQLYANFPGRPIGHHDTSGEICTQVNRLLEAKKSPLLVSLREQRYCLGFSLCEKACLKKKKEKKKKIKEAREALWIRSQQQLYFGTVQYSMLCKLLLSLEV